MLASSAHAQTARNAFNTARAAGPRPLARAAGVVALLGIAALPLDLPIVRWFHDGHCPSELLRWLSFCETYAYGFGVACILLAVAVLDGGVKPRLPRALTLAFGAGLMANLMKMLVAPHPAARIRPGRHGVGNVRPVAAAHQSDERPPKLSLRAHGHSGRPDCRAGVAVSARPLAVSRLRIAGRLPANVERLALLERRFVGGGDRVRLCPARFAERLAFRLVRSLGSCATSARQRRFQNRIDDASPARCGVNGESRKPASGLNSSLGRVRQ